MASKEPSTARALVNPVGLGAIAGAAAVAVTIGNPIFAAAGGALYVASVFVDAIRRRRARAKRRRIMDVIGGMPDLDDIRDPETRATVEKMLAARQNLQKVIDDTPSDILMQLQKTTDSLIQLDIYASTLVKRAEDTTAYLRSVNLPALVQEVKMLAMKAAQAKDPEARASFDQAKNARMEQIRALKELKANKERVDADLMRVVAVLGALPTKIVRLRALDAQAMEQLSGDITHDLTAMGEELKTSEQVIRELVPQ
ncbi:MAG TPA: hypothetical protein VL326_17275 [Kofleriaceae bacterium]|jgi:hypothetical protein|nr:hypothetical protein [Kofleriaceae bacterium]